MEGWIVGVMFALLFCAPLVATAYAVHGPRVLTETTVCMLLAAGYVPQSRPSPSYHCTMYSPEITWMHGEWKGTTREAKKRMKFASKLASYKLPEQGESDWSGRQIPDWKG